MSNDDDDDDRDGGGCCGYCVGGGDGGFLVDQALKMKTRRIFEFYRELDKFVQVCVIQRLPAAV